jgi:hypothetical protein
MKKLTLAVASLGFALALYAGVQPSSVLNGTTAAVGTNSTVTYFDNSGASSVIFYTGDSSTLGLGVGFVSSGTNGLPFQLTFEKSIDAIHWQSYFTWSPTANGTTAVFATTNLATLGNDVWAVRLNSTTNINTTSYITNLYLVGLTKLPR